MKIKTPKILFFIASCIPSEAEKEEASKIPLKICYRNANYFNKDEGIEICDFVAGLVPEKYLNSGCRLWATEDSGKEIKDIVSELENEKKEKEVAKQNEFINTQNLPKWKPN